MQKKRTLLLLVTFTLLIASFISVVNAQTTYTLTMDSIGNGDITPTFGNHIYNSGDTVQVFANASSGWVFTVWNLYDGNDNYIANTTQNPVTLTMTQNYKSVATFTEIPPTPTPESTTTPPPVQDNSIYIALAITFFFVCFSTVFFFFRPCFEIVLMSLLIMAFAIIIGAVVVLPINTIIGIFMVVYTVFVFIINVLRLQA